MLWNLELSQKSPLNGLQSGKPVILHILRHFTLFLRLVCHSVPLSLWALWKQRISQKRQKSPWKNRQNITDQWGREPFEARRWKTKQVLFHQLCTRRQNLEHGSGFLIQKAAWKVLLLLSLMNQYSDHIIWLYGCHFRQWREYSSSPEHFQLDEFESDSDSDYDETESEDIVEHRNSITRSERQIKA